ncbi:IclR family transcriptional regulator [Mesorhizobium sp. CO1-1-8]|uniref:IclR family transcriptional regulator n=1 Tax=Mesorhizobium sp. CO1-1-8 TaxID=2876631 RepID=UPI001CD09B76|nr:IclR family transcriptional regulator [Mesorhizobium sp. CO1-1-8]MBZ9772374.1 IclR family transcriptional regulator [Mesorhizobium sp. CO1-1-8]
MASGGRGIQSIDVGGAILRALVAEQRPVTLRDLANAADMAPAQVHAYLTSFRRIDLVEQDAQTGQYSIGPFALRLGLGRIHGDPILNEVSKALAPLSAETGLMSVLSVWGPQGPTVVQTQDGKTSLNVNIRMGTLFSVVGTATGWTFAAFKKGDQGKERVKFELSSANRTLLIDPSEAKAIFDEAVKATRERGYAKIAGGAIPDVNAVSAPVFDGSAELVAVITMIGTGETMDLTGENPAIERLLAAAKDLSR